MQWQSNILYNIVQCFAANINYKATYSQNILPSQYFISMDIHIWSTYLKSFCPNFFFWKSMAQKYPTYLQFGQQARAELWQAKHSLS